MAVPNRTGVPDKTSQTEQYVLNYSFDELYKILMVGLAAYNSSSGNYDRIQIDNATGGLIVKLSGTTVGPNGGLYINTIPLATRTDSATTTSVTYVGKAAIGSATSAAAWQIFKMDEAVTNTLTITWAGGSSGFTNIWDNRASLSYS